jgi:hypothetical protein
VVLTAFPLPPSLLLFITYKSVILVGQLITVQFQHLYHITLVCIIEGSLLCQSHNLQLNFSNIGTVMAP